MKFLPGLFSLALSILLLWTLNTKLGDIPPIGKFMNPYSGFWNNAESTHKETKEQNLILGGLKGKVTIRFDEHRVPHIFAENDEDLYYTQGYLTARDRLFQMDIQTRSASGRLSEIVGPKALDIDRYHRRMGMVYGAENTFKGMEKDPSMRSIIYAYAKGINEYIAHLKEADYPIEFKLLDYAPEKWAPINSAFLLKLMSETLAGGTDQLEMSNNLNHFGVQKTEELFPDISLHEDPIIPKGTVWNFTPIKTPSPTPLTTISEFSKNKVQDKVEGIGSNNWALSGKKTKSGYPLLANDPHLHLTLPSIWYQVQLSSPSVNVYGVSLPGTPCIIIGYNQNISWGVTNVDADVLDWYTVKFKDNKKEEYWYDGHWNKVKKRIERIEIRGEKPLHDTVLFTHQGPVVYDSKSQKPKNRENIPLYCALHWVAHDESDDIKTFYLLNRGKNYEDYRKALTYYTAPAQNFIFSSTENDISITPNGHFPLKFKDQGKYILDGSLAANDWQGWIPYEQNPTVKNPERGYVSSANQTLTDKTYPYYINWAFGPYERGKRINDRLSKMKDATSDSMRILQTDSYSLLAQDILPAFFSLLDTTAIGTEEKSCLHYLRSWNKEFRTKEIGATLFSTWWTNFYTLVWDDKFNIPGANLKFPSRDRTEQLLLEQPDSKWFDNTNTPQVEKAKDLVNESFHKTVSSLQNQYGTPGQKWEWGRVKKTYIQHLANIPGFGIENFPSGGTSSVVNALSDGTGPSWRMVVQMGRPVQGYGVFPGGESGNPGSTYYDDLFSTWNKGNLTPLLFLNSGQETSSRIKSTLILQSK